MESVDRMDQQHKWLKSERESAKSKMRDSIQTKWERSGVLGITEKIVFKKIRIRREYLLLGS